MDISAIDVADLARRYLAGESEKALAESLGVSRTPIRRLLLKAGVEPRNRSAGMYVRMARTGPEERARLTEAAHAAARGRTIPFDELCRNALGTQSSVANISAYEYRLCDLLAERGVAYTQQRAYGPYNVDVTVGRVAVEILGGNWHASKSHGQRIRYLLDSGVDVLYIWSTGDFKIGPGAAEHVIAFAEEASGNPTSGGRYRVIRGNGQLVADFQTDRDEIPDVVPNSDLPKTPPASVPYGLCHCGCGRVTTIYGGEPRRYVSGHNNLRSAG